MPVTDKDMLKKSAFSVLAFLLLIFCIGNLVLGITWIGRSYPGFFFYGNMVVTDITPGVENGEQLTRFKDRVTEADGVRINSPDELLSITDALPVGTDVEYTIERNGSGFKVGIPVQTFTARDFIQMFGVIFLMGAVFFVIGAIVLRTKPNARESRAFFLFCAAICVWFTGSFDAQASHVMEQLIFFAWVFSPVAGIHLMFIFPSDTRIKASAQNIISLVFLFISAMLFILQFIFFHSYDVWKYINTATWIYVVLSTAIFPASSLMTYLHPASALAKQRAQIILLGCIFGLLIPALAATGITVFNINLPYNLMALPVVIFPLSIAYAIVKHKLFDIDVILEKALTYGLLTGAVVAMSALTIFAFNVVFARYGGWRNPAFFVVLSAFLVIALNPLKNRIQDFVDLTFFRKKYDYKRAVEEVSYAMTSLLSLDKIVDKIISIIESTMFASPVLVYIYNQDTGAYEAYVKDGSDVPAGAAGPIGEDGALVRELNQQKKELFREDIISDDRYKHDSEELLDEFDRFTASLFVPVFFKRQLIGFIVLGDKKSRLSYTSRDVNLLRVLANQSAIAIENALAFKLVEDYAKKLERTNVELKDMQTQLVHAEKMSAIGQLAAGVAHEIRNPLNIIEGARYYLSTYMVNEENSETVGEYLDYIKQEIDRTNRLIDSLLKFSKAEPPYFEKVDINSILENVVILVRKQLSDSDVKLSTKLDPGIPLIMADPNQLWQVFINIILNAIQAMPKGGCLAIETSLGYSDSGPAPARNVCISFEDTGVGIAKDDISRIFDPFFTKKDMGTGLGLSIAYKIIEKHSGRIIVSSEKDKGTIFTIELPANNLNIKVGEANG
ncbi:MAG: GAF domain-containing protein [Candidatus Dadabacteria bacterium]|nr:GAF domain-containing protein [Candidatus Dadabacteria bacterium]